MNEDIKKTGINSLSRRVFVKIISPDRCTFTEKGKKE
jgi:hypothetical protein